MNPVLSHPKAHNCVWYGKAVRICTQGLGMQGSSKQSNAFIAQLVEHTPDKGEVVGSEPTRRTRMGLLPNKHARSHG